MPLSVEEIASLVSELQALSGARLEKVHQRDAHSIVLTLKVPRSHEESRQPSDTGINPQSAIRNPQFPRKVFLLLSARPRFERVHLLESRGETMADAGEFAGVLKSRVVGARLVRVRQPGRGRAVEIDLEEPRGPGSPPHQLILAAEMGGSSSNIALLTRGRQLIASLVPVRRGGQELAAGGRYDPGPSPHPGAMAGVAASPWRYLDPSSSAPGEEASPLAARFPLNLALGAHSARAEARAVLEESRERLRKRLAAALKKRRTLRSRLEEDLAGAREGEKGLRLGELLKGEMHRLRRGQESVEVVDWYAPDQKKISIPLDPARSPLENIEKFFERHRKAQRAGPFIAARIARVEDEIRLIEELEAAAARAGEDPELAAVLERARPLLPPERRAGAGAKKGGEAPAAAGPLRFVSSDGLEILVGRSARENDHLTFHLARGNDVFLHLSGRPGAHVVLRTAEGRPPPLSSLLDAAQLALYYSLPVRSRGEIARGASGDIDYVEVKHVRKPRGGKPGQVLLARHRTLRVALEDERLARLRSSAAGGGAADGGGEGGVKAH
jgi:predicted ribosome quality control (RQC) complex YloA/Tae2 family protein